MNKETATLLEQHFNTAFAAPDGIAKLRELILTLAMQGRLVKQDPNDPPASELLKEIEAEKQRLIKEKRIKKLKPLPPIKPEDVPYALPQGWEWIRLGEILIFGPKNGYSPTAVDYETPVRSLTLSATTSGTFKGEYSKYIGEHIEEDSSLWLEDGDILVQRGNTIEYVGVSAIFHGEQHRIVARIDQLMALCDSLEQQIGTATGKQTELLNAVMAQIY